MLTVDVRRERRIVFSGAQEEDSTVDGDRGSKQRGNLELIESACCVGLLSDGVEEVEYKQENNEESLDYSTCGREQHRDEYHSDFAEHDN